MHGKMTGVAAVLAAAVLAAVARGQMQVQTQGSALDANPQVGSGGSNTPVAGYVPINGNDIVTGNVSGLAYFHAPVGTTSPYTFQGTLGTSTLRNFARQSAGGIPSSPGQGLNSVYYLPSATVSTAQGSLYTAPARSGFDSRIVPVTSAAPTAAASINSPEPVAVGLPLRGFADNPSVLNPAGGAITSPLFSLRNEAAPGAGSDRTAPGDSGNGGTRGGASGDNTDRQQPGTTDDRTGTRANGDNGLLPRSAAAGRVDDRAHSAADEGQELMRVTGTYADLLKQLDKARGGSGVANDQPGNGQAGTGMAGTGMGGTGQTGGRGGRGELGLNGERNVAIGDTGTRGGRGGAANAVTPGRGGTGGVVALGASGGAQPVGAEGFQSTDPTKANYRPSLSARQATGVDVLAQTSPEELRAGRSVGEIKTLAAPAGSGAQAPAFEELLKQGEAQMKAGKFMEAADVYQRALTIEPNNALAVLGRGNAELSAGMYESAAADLQFVFTKKPELVSVKYALGDYVPLQRQVFLTDDLRKLGTSKETGNMASFLLCYLSYQTGRGEELKAELDRWAARPWRDQWQVVAEKAWR